MPATLLAGAFLISFLLAPGKTLAVVCVLVVTILWFKGQSRAAYRSDFGTKHHTAIHEGGHVVVARDLNIGGVRAVLDRGSHDHDWSGFTYHRPARTPLDDCIVAAAGTQATNMIYGENKPTTKGDAARIASYGPNVDSAAAHAIARRMVHARRSEIERIGAELSGQEKA